MPVFVQPGLEIPDEELRFETSTAGGPGGQHVNKTDSAVTLIFDVAGSPSLDEERRARLLQRLASRLTRDGLLRVTCRSERSQHRNRSLVVERFAEILREGLHRPKTRKPTKATRGSQKRRLDAKKRRSEIKRGRGRPGDG
ncbi:MAG: alternative ribosome rescue aminoacyl-tRNA hydrolase ArfB [Planctomycetota bacterium]